MKKWKINMSEYSTKVSDLGMVSFLGRFSYRDRYWTQHLPDPHRLKMDGYRSLSDLMIWNHLSLTVEKTRRYVNDISDDNLADFIDNFAKMVLIDYTKLDFPSLLVYLCQRRGTRKYIGDMFEVSQTLICRVLTL